MLCLEICKHLPPPAREALIEALETESTRPPLSLSEVTPETGAKRVALKNLLRLIKRQH